MVGRECHGNQAASDGEVTRRWMLMSGVPRRSKAAAKIRTAAAPSPARIGTPRRPSVPHHSSETIRMDNGEQATPPLNGSRGTSWLLIQEARLHWRCIGLALGRRAAPLSGSHPIRVALLLLSSTGKERALRAHRI